MRPCCLPGLRSREGEAAVGVFFGDGDDEAQIGGGHFALGVIGARGGFAHGGVLGEKAFMGRRTNFSKAASLPRSAASWEVAVADLRCFCHSSMAFKCADLVGDVVRHDHDFFGDFGLVIEFGIGGLEGLVQPF